MFFQQDNYDKKAIEKIAREQGMVYPEEVTIDRLFEGGEKE